VSALPTAVLCGNVTLDRTPEGLEPGGPAYYAGQAWRALGARVRVLTAAAGDFPPAALEGIEVVRIPSSRTTVFQNRYGPGGARVQRVEAQAAPLRPEHLPAGWERPDVLHLAPVLSELDPAPFRFALRPRWTGLCLQGLVRTVGPDGAVAQPPWDPAPGLLASVDVAFLGEDDLRGQRDLLDRLARAVPLVVFTRGAQGCEVIAGGRSRRVGVFPVEEVDPTGAGDVFAAGFLFALAQGAEPPDAARLGAAAASFVVQAPGGEALSRVGGAFQRMASVSVER
jgi:1D-myo-inositol 3-kinase